MHYYAPITEKCRNELNLCIFHPTVSLNSFFRVWFPRAQISLCISVLQYRTRHISPRVLDKTLMFRGHLSVSSLPSTSSQLGLTLRYSLLLLGPAQNVLLLCFDCTFCLQPRVRRCDIKVLGWRAASSRSLLMFCC